MLRDWTDREFCYLTTTGRRTGRPHTIEIWFAIHDDRLYMLSGGRDSADWVRNVQADPNVTVRAAEQTIAGRARVLEPHEDEDVLARRLLVEKYEPIDHSSLTEWGRSSLPVVVEFPSA